MIHTFLQFPHSVVILGSRRLGSVSGLHLPDLVTVVGKTLGLEQLCVGGHHGEAVDSVPGGNSGCTTGLGIIYLWAVGRRVILTQLLGTIIW